MPGGSTRPGGRIDAEELSFAADHGLWACLALSDVSLGRIVTTRYVGEPHTHRRTMLAVIAPQLGAVGKADAQQVVGAGVETIRAGDDQDIAILGGDYPTGNPGSFGRVSSYR